MPTSIHIAFGKSAAHDIRKALTAIGHAERVIGLPDNLSWGPISSPTGLRQTWFDENLGRDWEEVLQETEAFWEEATSPLCQPIAWVSRHCAMEHAGFLEFVWRMGHAPFEVIDVTRLSIVSTRREEPYLVTSLGIVPSVDIARARLHERRAILSADTVSAYRELWRRLRAENAALRVIDGTELVSAPINHFDDTILSFTIDEWQKAARIVGATMGDLGMRPVPQYVGDIFLWSRVRALMTSGALEFQGDDADMHRCVVRRRASA
jgi:hypothetical protein